MLNIKTPGDIIIPFDRIGDKDWARNTRYIIESYNHAIHWEKQVITPLSEQAISTTEKRLGTAIPTALKQFYLNFGIADIGEQLQSLDNMIWLKDIWQNPQYKPDFSKQDLIDLPYLVTFSDYLGNGNQFCFHSETHQIFYYDHDTLPYLSQLFDSVDDYLKGCLIHCQMELFDNDIEQETVATWCEERLIQHFGESTIRK